MTRTTHTSGQQINDLAYLHARPIWRQVSDPASPASTADAAGGARILDLDAARATGTPLAVLGLAAPPRFVDRVAGSSAVFCDAMGMRHDVLLSVAHWPEDSAEFKRLERCPAAAVRGTVRLLPQPARFGSTIIRPIEMRSVELIEAGMRPDPAALELFRTLFGAIQ